MGSWPGCALRSGLETNPLSLSLLYCIWKLWLLLPRKVHTQMISHLYSSRFNRIWFSRIFSRELSLKREGKREEYRTERKQLWIASKPQIRSTCATCHHENNIFMGRRTKTGKSWLLPRAACYVTKLHQGKGDFPSLPAVQILLTVSSDTLYLVVLVEEYGQKAVKK